MKKKDIFDKLRNADDSVIEKLTELCEAVSNASDDRIFSKIEKKCSSYSLKFETDYADEVRGVDIYMKSKWKKPAIAAVTCLLIVGGVIGGSILTAKKLNNKSTLSAQPVRNENGKIVVTLAYVASDTKDDGYSYKSPIYHFNQQSSDYEVDLVVYTEEEGKSALSKLSADLADGQTPDMIYAKPYQLRFLYNRGYLADLGEVMDEYNGVKRDEIVPALLNAITVDSHIPAIPDFIDAETVCIKTEILGKSLTNWNFEQAICFYNSLSDEDKMKLFENDRWGKQYIADFFIKGAIISSMDYKSYAFDPENGLRQALEFIDNIPDDPGEYNYIEDLDLVSDPMITFPCTSPSTDYSSWVIGVNKGKDVSLVGYPTENGVGALVRAYNGFGIMRNSSCKQGAWDYINYNVIGDEAPCVAGGFSIPFRESLYLERYDSDPKIEYSINKEYNNIDGSNISITDAQKQQLKDYIAALDICIYRDEELENIIREECSYVVSGERTPDQCIDILNDRIGTYLAENK